MDARLTRLYQDELTHLRELGGEFAREHPKIAGRLNPRGSRSPTRTSSACSKGLPF